MASEMRKFPSTNKTSPGWMQGLKSAAVVVEKD
jgi:hypothetical protein